MCKMYQLVINNLNIGSFALSKEAILLGRKISNNPLWGGEIIKGDNDWLEEDYLLSVQLKRHDETLIKVFTELGNKTALEKNGLKLIEIDEPEYELFINELGKETVTPKSKYNFIKIEAS